MGRHRSVRSDASSPTPPRPRLARSRLSMRFVNAPTERRFVSTHAGALARNLFWLGLIGCCASITSVVRLATADLASDEVIATWRLNLSAAAACTAISFLVTLAGLVPGILGLLSPQRQEVAIVILLLIVAALQFVLDPWYGAKVLQKEPSQLVVTAHSMSFSDTRLVLVLSIVVITSHLALPIRWICLLPLEVLPGCLYAGFAFILGGPDGDQAWSTLLLLQSLIMCAVIGRWTVEDYQRQAFCMLIAEKNLRAQTEFRLEQLERPSCPRQKRHERPCNSDARSRPETTPSCLAFEMIGRSAIGAGLNILIDLGRQEQWYVDSKELMLEPMCLGEGGFGVVLAGDYHGSHVAVKANKLDAGHVDHRGSAENLISLLNEVRILRRLRHPNIVILHGACLDADHGDVALVLERVYGKTLEDLIREDSPKKEQLQSRERLRAIVDISRALRYLHSRGPPVVHGDLKASNIVAEQVPGLSGFHRMKLLDFGLARTLTRHAKPLGGTLLWVAPEVVLYPHQPPHVAADVFSFGRVAFFVLTGRKAIADETHEQIIDQIEKQCTPVLPWPFRFEPDLERCRSHVDSCTEFQACLRPSMEKVGKFFESTIEDRWYASSGGEDGWPTSQSMGSIGSIRERLSQQQQVVGVAQPAQKTTARRADRFRVNLDLASGAMNQKAFSPQSHTVDTMSIMPWMPKSERPAQPPAGSRRTLPDRPMFLSDRPSRGRDIGRAWNVEAGHTSVRDTWFRTTPTCPQPALAESERSGHTFAEYMSE